MASDITIPDSNRSGKSGPVPAAPSGATGTLAQDATAETHRATAARFLRALHAPGDWFEVRALDCPDRKGGTYRGQASAYHDDPETAASDALKLDALGAAGVYVTINPADPACNARAFRRIVYRPKSTTGDVEVIGRRWLPVDLDPDRPAGIAATDAERTAALNLAERVRGELAAAGWPAPVQCSTPNGAHLLYRVELPNDPDAADLLRRVFEGLGVRFNGDGVKVDRSLFNASRILRIPGTTGRKGDITPERPHRRGELLVVPAELVPVSWELLEAVATPKPVATPARATTPPRAPQGALHAPINAGSTFDRFDPTPDGVRSYLERHGVPVARLRADGDGTMLDLRKCPIAGSAGGTSVSVRVGAGGLVTYHNLHNGGSGLTWADVRDSLEPGYRAHSERMKGRADSGNPFDPLPGARNTPASGTAAPAVAHGGTEARADDDREEWESPIPLDGAAVLPEFPLDALPGHVAGFVRELAASLEVCPDMPAAFALGVGAAACQGKFTVHVRADHREPLNLFILVALPPAELKSATIREALAPLLSYEKELQERERENVKTAENKYHVDAERRKVLLKKSASAKEWEDREAAKRELDGLPAPPDDPPSLPRLTAGADVLPEVLAKLLNQYRGRLTLYDAEGGTLFGNFGGRYSSGNPNFEILLKAHAGDDVLVDRQSKPAIAVRRPCLTVILAVQPDVVRRLADTPQFRERGLAGRFLFSFPLPMAGCRKFDGPPVSEDARTLYGLGIKAALDMAAERDADGREVARELTFSPDALEVFQEMARAVGAQMRDGGELHGIQDWAGKAHGGAARVAGVLHVLEHSAHGLNSVSSVNSVLSRVSGGKRFFLSSLTSSCTCGGDPGAVPVSTATVAHAWQIVTYYKAHALHAYSLMGADADAEQARRILVWIREKKFERFTQRDCHRRFQADALTASALNAPLSLLEDRHYIRREPDQDRKPGHRGRKPSPLFTVNPLCQN